MSIFLCVMVKLPFLLVGRVPTVPKKYVFRNAKTTVKNGRKCLYTYIYGTVWLIFYMIPFYWDSFPSTIWQSRPWNLRHSKGFTHILDHVGGVYYFTIELMGLPSGKHTKNYGKSPFYSWVNQRTKWQFSIANCNSLPEGTCTWENH